MRVIQAALHSHASHSWLSEFLHENLGAFGEFLDSVIFHSLIDTLKLVLFLFITYIIMELIEHKASDKARRIMQRSGSFGPLLGGLLGVVPQCGFSAAASNLYTGRVITLGTLVAVFLSTSDEMIPILLSGNIEFTCILSIIIYKTVVGIAIGFIVDIVFRIMNCGQREISIDELCDNDKCHCERGVFYSALHHTITTGAFILVTTLIINLLIFIIGEKNLSNLVVNIPVVSHLICALIGLIPNCAVSVALSQLALTGVISYGTMLAGLFSGAGAGLLVLFKVNKNKKEIALIAAILVVSGTLFGALAELIPFI